MSLILEDASESHLAEILEWLKTEDVATGEGFYCNRGHAVATGVLATQSIDILFQVCLPSSGLHVPVSPRDCAISPRTIMNNTG